MRKGIWKKTKSISFVVSIFAFILLSSNLGQFANNLNAGDNTSSIEVDSDENGFQFLMTPITEGIVAEMKKANLEREASGEDLCPIIDGHGTGLACTSEELLDSLVGKLACTGVVQDSSHTTPRMAAATNLAEEQYFPIVGNQGSQGSCTTWATVYYAYGYLEARDNGWDAASGNPNYLLSPSWIYNKVAAADYGSGALGNAKLMMDWGVTTLANMPYDDSTTDPWGEEAAWREAPYHRPLNYTKLLYDPSSILDTIKALLMEKTPVTFYIDARQYFNNLDDYILSSAEYDSSKLNHANCIVGFNDSVTADGDIGAFRVVNSWGANWGDGGYYWLTYNAFKEFAHFVGQDLFFFTDRIDYKPSLIATWEFSVSPTIMQDVITLGVGPVSAPLATTMPFYCFNQYNLFPTFMAIDISDFQTQYDADPDVFFFVKIGSATTIGSTTTPGVISAFNVERYVGGVLAAITSEAVNTPVATPGYAFTTFKVYAHEIKVSLELLEDPQYGGDPPCGNTYTINAKNWNYAIKAMVWNIGSSDETKVELHLILDGTEVNSTTFSSLAANSGQSFTYMWTPGQYKTYNFSIYSPLLVGETHGGNNEYSEQIAIKYLRNYSMTPGHMYTWVDAITGGKQLSFNYWNWNSIQSLPFSFTYYDTNFTEVYLCDDGWLSFVKNHWPDGRTQPFPYAGARYAYSIAPCWRSVNGSELSIFIKNGPGYCVIAWIHVRLGAFEVVLNETGDIVFNYDLNFIPWGCTCGLNYGLDSDYYNAYQGLTKETGDFSILFERPSEHDLKAQVDVPRYVERGQTYRVSTQIQNIGQYVENDVTLELDLNGDPVIQLAIGQLQVGEMETITYWWTPVDYGVYNFAAYTPAITGESHVDNNMDEKRVPIFEGMVLSYNVTVSSQPDTVEIFTMVYSQISDYKFHVNLTDEVGETAYSGYWWDEDAMTRIIKNSTCFEEGFHTPNWIFTDVLVGDLIPIYILTNGRDDLFNVTRELTPDLPQFKPIKVFELQDLTAPGGIAWYEKTTGILIKGTFPLQDSDLYTLELINTNANYMVDITAPKWNPIPVDQVIEFGAAFSHDVNASDISGIAYYRINDTARFAINTNGLITSTMILPVGEYWVEIRAYDPSHNYRSATIQIMVQDTLDPTWVQPPVDQVIEHGITFSQVVNASDVSGIAYYWVNDTARFAIDASGVLTSTGCLAVGIYWVEIRAYDPSHNYCSATIRISVVSAPPVQVTIFEGMVLSYNYTMMDQPGSFIITMVYSQISEHIFLVDSTVGDGETVYWGYYWDEDATTRIIGNSTGFEEGFHTPNWIFTTVQVGELIPIYIIDGSRDNIFNVTRELTPDLPQFKPIKVLELQDLTAPGGMAWYEKTTGILIKGTFPLQDSGFYTLELINTNAIDMADVTAPKWNPIPVDQVIEAGAAFSHDVNASDVSGITYYWVNDSARFTINTDGLITSTMILPVGEYWVEIQAFDACANYCTATIRIIVQDTLDPTWVQPPVDQVIEHGIAFSHDVNASDVSGIAYYWVNDTARFAIDASGVLTSTGCLAVGIYWVEIRAYDPSHHYCSATIRISVVSAPPVQVAIFDGMFLTYNLTLPDQPSFSIIITLVYSQISENDFRVDMIVDDGGTGYCYEDATTRIMANSSGVFEEGFHTFNWIFTTVQVGDLIPIYILFVTRDDVYNITRELTPDLPQFEPITVFELQDLTGPGGRGIAWYEKTTGILINGTFFWDESYFYNLELINTNAIYVADVVAPKWNPNPMDQVIEFGVAFSHDVNASDFSGITYYWVNDSARFTINTDGLITSTMILPVGEYWVEIQAFDAYANYCTATIRIIVQDTLAPT